MAVSAGVLGLAGVSLLFVPELALGSLGWTAAPIVAQLLGALYAAWALANWTAKDSPLGGIYGRPLSLGNFGHFFVGALSLLRSGLAAGAPLALWVAGGLYAGLALAFGWLVFGATGLRPAPRGDEKQV